jgi:hypothetical protein
MTAADKLRTITQWLDYQSESVNQQFTSLKGIEAAYDYCQQNNLEFIDNDYLHDRFEGKELSKHKKARLQFFNL